MKIKNPLRRVLKGFLLMNILGLLLAMTGCHAKEYITDEEETEQVQTTEEVKKEYQIDDIMQAPDSYVHREITILGKLPQALLLDHSNQMVPVLWDEKEENYIVLNGDVEVGNCDARATGTLSYNGYDYVLDLSNIVCK